MGHIQIIIGFMILLQVAGVVANIFIIGKPREPLTAGTAIVGVFLACLQVSALFYMAHHVS